LDDLNIRHHLSPDDRSNLVNLKPVNLRKLERKLSPVGRRARVRQRLIRVWAASA
jgi:hypothetical protein